MKKIQLILMGIVLLIAYGCNSNIYSEQLKKERALIENYISRNGYVVVDTLPADDAWTENLYYRVSFSNATQKHYLFLFQQCRRRYFQKAPNRKHCASGA